MSNSTLQRLLSALAAAAVATFGGVAHAGFYGSDFDPYFFNGTATFQIGDNCLAQDGVHVANLFGCNHVDLEALPAPVVTLDDHLGHVTTLNFSGFHNDSADMLLVYVIDGKFKGIQTWFIGGVTANDAVHFPGLWWLEFRAAPQFSNNNSEVSALSFENNEHSEHHLLSVDNSVLLYQNCPVYHGIAFCSNGQLADTAHTVHFALIPEPGTLVLLVGALGAGWLSRRRKEAK